MYCRYGWMPPDRCQYVSSSTTLRLTFSWYSSAELSQGIRTGPGQYPPRQPHHQGHAGRRHICVDSSRRCEDATPYHNAHKNAICRRSSKRWGKGLAATMSRRALLARGRVTGAIRQQRLPNGIVLFGHVGFVITGSRGKSG